MHLSSGIMHTGSSSWLLHLHPDLLLGVDARHVGVPAIRKHGQQGGHSQ